MNKFKLFLAGALAFLFVNQAQALDLNKACDETFTYLLNEKLNNQKVIATAPGLPSRVHEMTMVAENPQDPKNIHKAYNKAEFEGWNLMIAQGRILEKLGIMKFESGTFEELNYNGQKFSFTGYLMKFTDKANGYIATLPSLGRIGIKVGVMGVDKVKSFSKTQVKNGKPSVDVEFTTTLYNKAPWISDEYLKATRIMSFVEGSQKVNMSFIDGKWQVDDEKFNLSLLNPVFDFE